MPPAAPTIRRWRCGQGEAWEPPIPGQTVGGGVPDAPETLRQRPSPGQSPAEGSRPLPTDRTIDGCSRQPPGRACPAPTARRPGNGCPRKPHSVSISPSVGRGAPTPPRPSAAANNNPCLPPWGKVAPQGRMRGRLPLPPIPGQAVGGGVPDAPETLRQRPSPGQSPAEGSRPLPTGRTIDGCSRQPPGRACPAPTARRPGNGCPRKPHSVSISPSVGRGAPTPPRPSAAANNNPCLPPWGKVAPQGRMRGRLPLPPIPGQAVGGGVPDAPETFRQRPSPGQSPAEGSRPLPTDRTIDGCSRQPPGRACPAPTARRPGNGCPRKPHSILISPSVGRGAPPRRDLPPPPTPREG